MAFTMNRFILFQKAKHLVSGVLYLSISFCNKSGEGMRELSILFPEYDKPYLLRSDNGSCYASQEFKDFCRIESRKPVVYITHN